MLELKKGEPIGILTVTAEVPDGWHTYSLTQPEDGPTRSTLKLNGTGLKLIGDFVPDEEPEKHVVESMGPVEEYRGVIIWEAPVRLSPDVDPEKLKVKIDLYAQICTDKDQRCKPPETYSGEIEFVGETADLKLPEITVDEKPAAPPKKLELSLYQPTKTHATLTGSVFTDDGSKIFKPGDTVTMEITANSSGESIIFTPTESKPGDGYTPDFDFHLNDRSGWTIVGPRSIC